MRLVLLSFVALTLTLAATSAFAQGLHADVHAGLDDVHSDGESAQGVTYGLTLGYALARGHALIGVQLDLDATDNKTCQDDVLLVGDRACVDARRDTVISLRGGAFVAPSTSIYATIGYANARFAARYEGAGIDTGDHETLDGVRLGAGMSTDIGRRLYGKLEYRYTNYEDGVTRHQGLLGVGVRF
jgi:outer membrane immunogenic protein